MLKSVNYILFSMLALSVGCGGQKAPEKEKGKRVATHQDSPDQAEKAQAQMKTILIMGAGAVEATNKKDCPYDKANYIRIPHDNQNKKCQERTFDVSLELSEDWSKQLKVGAAPSASFGCTLDELATLVNHGVIKDIRNVNQKTATDTQVLNSTVLDDMIICSEQVDFEADGVLIANRLVLLKSNIKAGTSISINAKKLFLDGPSYLESRNHIVAVHESKDGGGSLLLIKNTAKKPKDPIQQ